MIAAILLVVILVALALFVRRDIAEYEAFKQLEDTDARQHQFREWIVESFGFFVGVTLLVLIVLGRLGYLLTMPAEFAELSATIAHALPVSSLLEQRYARRYRDWDDRFVNCWRDSQQAS